MAMMPKVRQTVMSFQQNKIAQFMPRMTRSDLDMFVRCHGDIKDSYEKMPTKRRTMIIWLRQEKRSFSSSSPLAATKCSRYFRYLPDIFTSLYKV